MIYIEPDAGTTPVTAFIEQAQVQLLLNVYYVDDPDVLAALGKDVARGIHVYVQIAGNPFGMSRQKVATEESEITQTGAKLTLAPAQFEGETGHQSYDHGKYMASDQGVLIETANMDFSAFHRNREYIYTSSDPNLIKALSGVFAADYDNLAAPDVSLMANSLVISPGSEAQILRSLSQAGVVHIEVEELGDDPQIVQAMESKGPNLRIIVPRGGAKPNVAEELRAAGVQIRVLHGLYMHGKVIEGSAYDFVGSQNFSTTSLNYNREVGVLLDDPQAMKTLQDVFATDWSNSY